MIVTVQQQDELKIILSDYTKYHETYSEVYDHVLSALEEQNDGLNTRFVQKVHEVLNADFGGLSQLPIMEKQRVKWINNQIAKRQMHFAAAFFNSPLIICTIVTGIAIYQIASTKLLSIALLIAIYTMLAPTIIVGFRIVNNAFVKKGKPSIKNNMFNQIGIYGVILYNAINPHLITDHFRLKTPDTLHLMLVTGLIMFYFIYGLSFIRLYRSELKLQLAL